LGWAKTNIGAINRAKTNDFIPKDSELFINNFLWPKDSLNQPFLFTI
jgi:hypothetical protein